MALRKRLPNEYPKVVSTFNLTNSLDPSQSIGNTTNFFLRPITLENIDQCVFEALHKRFKIAGKELNLIPLDAEIAAIRFQNPGSFDSLKQYLSLPYFTMWRNGVLPITRSSSANKPTTYVVPTMKPQGVVYTEYIMPPPQLLRLSFTFKFVTTYREYLNEFETHLLEYFKNKRNVIEWDGERFEIMPAEQFTGGTLETVEREGSNGQSLYVLTYEIQVIAYTRDISQIQKRERPNTFTLNIEEKSGSQLDTLSGTISRLPQTKDQLPDV